MSQQFNLYTFGLEEECEYSPVAQPQGNREKETPEQVISPSTHIV